MAFGFMRTFFPETKKRRKNAAATRKAANNEKERLNNLFKSQGRAKPNNNLLKAFAAANKAVANEKANKNTNLSENEIAAAAKALENSFKESGIPKNLKGTRRTSKRTLPRNILNMYGL
jgi:hypothetical protein